MLEIKGDGTVNIKDFIKVRREYYKREIDSLKKIKEEIEQIKSSRNYDLYKLNTITWEHLIHEVEMLYNLVENLFDGINELYSKTDVGADKIGKLEKRTELFKDDLIRWLVEEASKRNTRLEEFDFGFDDKDEE